MAMTAEALYTMTTLMHTSSSVAVNRTLSLFSFRAILRDPGAVRWRGLKPAPYSPTDEPDRKPVGRGLQAPPTTATSLKVVTDSTETNHEGRRDTSASCTKRHASSRTHRAA